MIMEVRRMLSEAEVSRYIRPKPWMKGEPKLLAQTVKPNWSVDMAAIPIAVNMVSLECHPYRELLCAPIEVRYRREGSVMTQRFME